jgi:hypothetical protein
MLRGMADQHRRVFLAMLQRVGVWIVVRQPAVPTLGTTAVQRVLGTKADLTAVGATKRIKALLSNDYLRPETIAPGDVSEGLAALGGKDRVDAILRVHLPDAVPDDDTQARTLFDSAKDVVIDGTTFEVTGTKRTGFPPIGPYILWVGLKKSEGA